MGIFKRMQNIVTADIHSLLDKAEDPVSMLKLYTRELEEQMAKAQEALANQLFAERKLDALIGETVTTIAKRTRQAQLAVDREEDNIAEMALQERISNEKRLAAYQTQREALKGQVTTLTEQFKKLKEAHAELQYKELVLTSRLNAAKTIQETNASLQSFSADRLLKECSRLEARVWRMEAGAEASERAHRTLNKAYDDEKVRDEVQSALRELKEAKAR